MTVAAPCRSHRWFVPAGDDGIALAACFSCPAKQYQPTDGSRESVITANEMNKEHGFPLITVSSKRDYSRIKGDFNLKSPEEDNMVTTEERLARLRDNKGARERYDAMAKEVIADAVRLGSWNAACKLHNIPTGSVTGLVRHWRKQGLEIPLTATEIREIKSQNNHQRSHRWTDEEHELVRLHYDGTRESVNRLMSITGASFYGIKGQIANLGLARVKPADWSPEELEALEKMVPRYSIKVIAKKLHRSENAVKVKATRLHFSQRYRDGWYTKAEVAEICGVDHKKVQGWIDHGALKASWHHGHRPSKNGSRAWHIERKDLASFIRAYCRELQGRNIDVFIVLEVLGVIRTDSLTGIGG